MNVLSHLITLSLLILFFLGVRAFFRKRISARLMYALWLVVLLKLCLPITLFDVTLPFDMPFARESSLPAAKEELSILPSVKPTFDESVSDDIKEKINITYYPLESEEVTAETPLINSPTEENANTTALVSPSETASPSFETIETSGVTEQPKIPSVAKANNSIGSILPYLWLMGSVITILVFFLSGMAFRLRLKSDRRLLKQVGKTKVYVSASAGAPCVFGLIPVIYLTPAALASEVRAMILLHERAHIRHGDHIWSYVRIAAVSVYWWNPLVWLAAFLSQQDGELACDEAVASHLSEANRIAYARGLVDMIPQKRQVAIGFGNGSLKERIVRLTERNQKKVISGFLALTVCLLTVGCSFLGTKNSENTDQTYSHEENPMEENNDSYQEGRYLKGINDVHFFVDEVTLYPIVPADDSDISFADLTDGDVIRIVNESGFLEYPAQNPIQILEKVGDGNPEAVRHVLVKLAEYGLADVDTEHFMQAQYFLHLTVAEIEEHFGKLKLEYSEAGPGQPVYSISDVEGVHLVFRDWYMDDPLEKTMIPAEVILTNQYPFSINGLKMGDRIADVYDSNMIWSSVWYHVINGTAHMKRGGGAYDMEMVLHGFDYEKMPNEATASETEWDKWEAEFLKNPSGIIGNMRLSLSQPSILKQDIDSDGVPEIFQINVTAHGTELWVEEVHAFDGKSGKTLDIESPRAYLKKNAVFESDAEAMRVTIDGKTKSFRRDELDTPKVNQNVQLGYGMKYDYYVTADNGLGCAVGLMAGMAEYCGAIDLEYRLIDGAFVISSASPRAISKTPPNFDAEAFGKTIPKEKGTVLFWHRIFASGTVLYFCSPPKASDADKFIVYATSDYGKTLTALDIEMPHDIAYDTATPVCAGGGGGSGECDIIVALMKDGNKTYVSYDNFSYTDGSDWLDFVYRGVMDTDKALGLVNDEHYGAYRNGIYTYDDFMAVPSVREELTLRVNEALQAYRLKRNAYPNVFQPFPEGYPVPKDLTVAEVAAFSSPFDEESFGGKVLIPLVYESYTPNGKVFNKCFMELRWSVGVQRDYNVRIYLFDISFPIEEN